MLFVEYVATLAFFVLLGAAIYMLIAFYVCDSHNCTAFRTAGETAPDDTNLYVTTLLYEMYNDGIWPIPYIGGAIATALALWFLNIKFTTYNFGIMFFTVFVVLYFMFSFFGHHYINPISDYVQDYINTSCGDPVCINNDIVSDENNNVTINTEIETTA